MKKFYLQTLGCRLNQAESQELIQILTQSGCQLTKRVESADLIIINTCVVTHKAEREVRQTIRQLRRANPRARLIVAGCWVDKIQRLGGKIPQGIDQLLSNREKWQVKDLVLKNKSLKEGDYPQTEGRRLIWVQKGCRNQCRYCLTRLVRGPIVSKPIDQVVAEINQALTAGSQEVVLTGQNLSQYDDQGKTWLDLISRVLEETEVQLLRLGSINPLLIEPASEASFELTKKSAQRLVEIYQGIGRGRLARHLHLSLQSGSNRILQLMGRNYSIEEYEQVVNILRRGVRGINLTTDIIVGFPGETEIDFRQTLDFAQKMAFGKIHIFRYSPREGTLAARMESEWGRVDEKTKKIRAQQLSRLEKKMRRRFWQSQVGKRAQAIIWPDGRGLTDNYLPIFLVNKTKILKPEIGQVKLLALGENEVIGNRE